MTKSGEKIPKVQFEFFILANLYLNWQVDKVFNVNPKVKHLLIYMFSLALLISTLFISGVAKNKEELNSVKFGMPFSFVGQNVPQDGFLYFPMYLKFKVNSHLNFNWFSWKNFFIHLL